MAPIGTYVFCICLLDSSIGATILLARTISFLATNSSILSEKSTGDFSTTITFLKPAKISFSFVLNNNPIKQIKRKEIINKIFLNLLYILYLAFKKLNPNVFDKIFKRGGVLLLLLIYEIHDILTYEYQIHIVEQIKSLI